MKNLTWASPNGRWHVSCKPAMFPDGYVAWHGDYGTETWYWNLEHRPWIGMVVRYYKRLMSDAVDPKQADVRAAIPIYVERKIHTLYKRAKKLYEAQITKAMFPEGKEK